MAKYICINCGTFILSSALSDPYMCRQCERLLEGEIEEHRKFYLENY